MYKVKASLPDSSLFLILHKHLWFLSSSQTILLFFYFVKLMRITEVQRKKTSEDGDNKKLTLQKFKNFPIYLSSFEDKI